MKYLHNAPWTQWTRDERFFCSQLYHHAKADAARFSSVVEKSASSNGCTSFSMPQSGAWDLGYEVSFYRDYLWRRGQKASEFGVSSHRTFDLCLFGERAMVIIEAKVYETFEPSQNESFSWDQEKIRTLPELENLEILLVALASSRYFANQEIYGHESTLEIFDGKITWEQMFQEYGDPLLRRADELYKAKPDKTRS